MDKEVLQIFKSATRQSQIAQGATDGRFVERSIPSKKNYTRKTKHKKCQD